MADPKFYNVQGPFKLKDVTKGTLASLPEGNAGENEVAGVAPLGEAGPTDITFFHNAKYVESLAKTKAAACIVHPDFVDKLPENVIPLPSEKPYRAYAQLAAKFYPAPETEAFTSPQAAVHPSAKVGEGCYIGHFAVVEEGVTLGAGVYVGHHAVISRGVEIGTGTRIESHVTISHAIVGKGVLIKAGAKIGQKGFGFHMDEMGHLNVPQIGRVIIEDDAEIGANTTIDRGSGHDTVIGQGSRLDNQIQIGHNVKIGQHCVIVAQVGIAGSTELGNFVAIGGQAGLGGHLKIGDGVQMMARTAIMRDVEDGEKVAGAPGISPREFFRETIAVAKLAKTRGYK